jgi:hypothetical protein
MKTLNILILTILISFRSLAQSTSIEANVFKLHLSTNGCPTSDYTGSIFYNTNFNLLTYCTGANSSIFGAGDWIGTSSIYRNTNVGIRTGNPLYELDINGENRATNFYVSGKIVIGTTTPPTEKVEIVDRQLAIGSTADATTWRQRYIDASDRFDIVEDGLSRLLMSNGGSIGIGNSLPTYKFFVSGDVNYNGNLREGGFGTMASTETTVQKMVTTTLSITNNLIINANTCATWSSAPFPAGTFANPPAAFLGNKISGNSNDDLIVMTVENVTTSGVTVRFCNNKASAVALLNVSYSILAIGE